MNISFVLGIPAWTKRRFLRQLEIQEDNFASIFASIFSMSMTLSQEHILIPHLLVCCLFSAKIGGTFFLSCIAGTLFDDLRGRIATRESIYNSNCIKISREKERLRNYMGGSLIVKGPVSYEAHGR